MPMKGRLTIYSVSLGYLPTDSGLPNSGEMKIRREKPTRKMLFCVREIFERFPMCHY